MKMTIFDENSYYELKMTIFNENALKMMKNDHKTAKKSLKELKRAKNDYNWLKQL